MSSTCLASELRRIAASDKPTATHLSVSRVDASTVVKALSRLSPVNAEDLLSHGDKEMVFLAKAVLDNPKTAYAILKQNHRIILESAASRAKRKATSPRLPKGLSKTTITEKVFNLLKKLGMATTKKNVVVTRTVKGQRVQAGIKKSLPYSKILELKAALSKHYDVNGQASLYDGPNGTVCVHFVITGLKK